jgi:hypothetical protein
MGIVPLAMSMEERKKHDTEAKKEYSGDGGKVTIVSSHQNTQKKKRYCRKKIKAETAARRSTQKKPASPQNGCT